MRISLITLIFILSFCGISNAMNISDYPLAGSTYEWCKYNNIEKKIKVLIRAKNKAIKYDRDIVQKRRKAKETFLFINKQKNRKLLKYAKQSKSNSSSSYFLINTLI
jgi:hypothetical protein